MKVDALILGGGAAGLWLLDELVRSGFHVVLIENSALGTGQTIATQGIVHGGLKYAITGTQDASVTAIRKMPELWRDCIAGRRLPDLGETRVRSDYCWMWRTASLKSTLGMVGARAGLRSMVEKVAARDRPAALQECPGDVFRLSEQVIDPESFLHALAARHQQRLLRADDDAVEFVTTAPGVVHVVRLTDARRGDHLDLRAKHVILTAGAGNAKLRERVGLGEGVMQRRPLHMVLLRGNLPELYGHCIDGAHTRITATSAVDSCGRRVWQIGGQVAEDGVAMDAPTLIKHTHAELIAVLPGVDLSGVEWSTYRVDRAEIETPRGARPAGPVAKLEGNVITAWPTKLALCPHLAMLVRDLLPRSMTHDPTDLRTLERWARPAIATLPWETERQWVTLQNR